MASSKYKEKLVILDAHAIIHRAYHALPDFSSSAGEPTGGLYGLASMLIKIITDLKPDYIVAAYDLPEPTFRKQVYDDYKAGRKEIDDILITQINRSRDIFSAFNIPIFEAPGFEADDVIGTIVRQVSDIKDLQTVIASGDMDTLQLVSGDQVLVYTLKKGINDTILYGEKEVVERFNFKPELLPDYKGLRGDPSDNIIGIAGIGEKTATTLISEFGSLEAIYKKLEKGEEPFLSVGLKSRIVNLLREGEEEAFFSKTLATIRLDAPIDFSLPEISWPDSFQLEPIENLFNVLDFRSLLSRVKNIFSSSNEIKNESELGVGVNDLEREKIFIAFWLLHSDKTNPTWDDIKHHTSTDEFSVAQKKIFETLKKEGLSKVYQEIELPLIPIIKKAETRGVLVDKTYLEKLSKDYHKEVDKLEKEIYRQVGEEFNINSPKQLGEVLFDKLKLTAKGLKKTAGGARSTKESELEKLKDSHPVIKFILQHREFRKLLTTYIDNIPKMLDEGDRLHTKLHQAGATTGRMSSSDPNLQNIPVKAGSGEAIRRAFVASPGHVWVGVDYSQIEMRVLALLSGDRNLLEVFKSGKDVHSSVASLVFGVKEDQVTKDMRRQAKVINFGIVYGMGVNALRVNLGTDRAEAQKFYDNYFSTFPDIKDYFDRVVSDAHEKGYTETMFGRRRYFPGLKSKLPFIRASNQRMAMNAPLQGTAADIIKLAMIKTETELAEVGLINQCHFLLPVHDELIYEVQEDKAEEASRVIKGAMEAVVDLEIPLVVDVAVGKNWGEI